MHRTNVLEQRCHLPHDPVRHATHAQGHSRDSSDRAHANQALHPQPQTGAGHPDDQRDHQQMVDDLEGTYQAHLRVAAHHEIVHGGTGKGGLTVRVREQLYSGNICIGVGDTTRHRGARIRLGLANTPKSGHEICHRDTVRDQPGHQRPQQADVKPGRQHRDGDEIHANTDHHVGGGKDHLAHRQRRLHDLGGNTTGELVGVKRHALTQHQSVEIPAQAQGKVDCQRLVLDDGLSGHQQGAGNQNAGQQFQHGSVLSPKLVRSYATEPVHHLAEHGEKQSLECGNASAQHGQYHDIATQPKGAGPDKGKEVAGRKLGLSLGIRLKQFFKQAKQGGSPRAQECKS